MTYPIVELADDVPAQLEQLGTKTKFWFRDEGGQKILFKEGRPGTGENWAEKVCCEICRMLHCHMQNMILLFGKVVGA